MSEVTRDDFDDIKDGIISSLVDSELIGQDRFICSLERMEERVQGYIDEIIIILQDHISKEILIQAVTQFESIQLLLITDKLNRNKHFTRNQIVTIFLAILDNVLSLIYENVTISHFELLRKNMKGLSNGKSFSYNNMKKIQIELIQSEYITKIRKIGYTLKLKDSYCQIISNMMSVYPQFKDQLSEVEVTGYDLIHSRAIPKLEVTKSAVVVIASLLPIYFKKKEEKQNIWKYIEEIIDEDEEQLKRKIYRFRSNLRKMENVDLFNYKNEK
ncbi:MAG: hypothetical protein H7641_01835 [Candidatus Heimdallarchaeota archaeon]|nr:hypothetical protein [Candidatus Heimdallarchaeota archaeon]MCK4876304.1 hypothetical protein [Candidatus Heimdallarchaeota archaeon]